MLVDGAGWTICDCLKRVKQVERYRRSGVPPVYDRETWSKRLRNLGPRARRPVLEAACALKKGKPLSGGVVLSGPYRCEIAALLLRAACDGGVSALWVDVPKLIDLWMSKRDQRTDPDPHRVGALVVIAGREPRHSYNRHVMEKLVKTRRDYQTFTIVVSDGDPSRLGALYSRGVEAIIESFIQART